MMFVKPMLVGAITVSAGLFSAGCTHDRPDRLPSSAQLVVEGDSALAYKAPTDGMVYVYDMQDNRIVYSGDVTRGQTVKVDTDKNRIMVGDELGSEKTLKMGHPHRIFFDSHGMTESRTVIRETRTIP